MPERIQRKRTKGWRMPENAVYVGRPTILGNPFRAVKSVHGWEVWDENLVHYDTWDNKIGALWHVLNLYEDDLLRWGRIEAPGVQDAINGLRGKDLACWCSTALPCHATVLLRIANA